MYTAAEYMIVFGWLGSEMQVGKGSGEKGARWKYNSTCVILWRALRELFIEKKNVQRDWLMDWTNRRRDVPLFDFLSYLTSRLLRRRQIIKDPESDLRKKNEWK